MSLKIAALQIDILEWLVSKRAPLQRFREERCAMQKGFIGYLKDAKDFFDELRGSSAKDTQIIQEEKKEDPSGARSMSQFYESEELTRRMKWKRVTWDDDADFAGFSRRVLDNDAVLKNVPAFSFLSIHIQKDSTCAGIGRLPPREASIELGSLTNWVLQERTPIDVDKYIPSGKHSLSGPFAVDWTAGEVKISDAASVPEILTFLLTAAPRLEALQVRMEEQQTKLNEDLQKVKIRVGVDIKINEHDTTFWDDPKRKFNPDYVNPNDAQQFVESMLSSAFLYRWFLKGQCVRIIPPGRSYSIDMEKKEIQIPSNFSEYNWRIAHGRFEALERFFSRMRALWWMWFSLGIVVVGDLELL